MGHEKANDEVRFGLWGHNSLQECAWKNPDALNLLSTNQNWSHEAMDPKNPPPRISAAGLLGPDLVNKVQIEFPTSSSSIAAVGVLHLCFQRRPTCSSRRAPTGTWTATKGSLFSTKDEFKYSNIRIIRAFFSSVQLLFEFNWVEFQPNSFISGNKWRFEVK